MRESAEYKALIHAVEAWGRAKQRNGAYDNATVVSTLWPAVEAAADALTNLEAASAAQERARAERYRVIIAGLMNHGGHSCQCAYHDDARAALTDEEGR